MCAPADVNAVAMRLLVVRSVLGQLQAVCVQTVSQPAAHLSAAAAGGGAWPRCPARHSAPAGG